MRPSRPPLPFEESSPALPHALHSESAVAHILQNASLVDHPLSESEMRSLLEALARHSLFLSTLERFSDDSYCRNRIFGNEHLELLLLCWKPGQRTPIHNHAGSRCGVYVVRGVACEVGFKPSPAGPLLPTGTHEVRAGSITSSYDGDTHLVGNFSSVSEDLVTLHCYSPPLASMRVFEERDTFFSDYSEVVACAASSGCYQVKL